MLLSALSSALAGSTPSTTWRTVRDAAGGWVLERNGSPHVLHGVCYSPSEIGSAGPTELFDSGDAKYVGSFGDVFWDAPAEAPHLSWGALWGSGTAITGGRGAGRADLQAIASYGFNSVRVYSMLSRVFAIQRGVVSPAADCTRRTHAAFLDEAARQGLSVLVGIPMPIEMWHLSNRRGAHASLVSWWESVLEETARDLGSHPATLGFVLMNELDDAFNAFPGAARRHAPSPHRRGPLHTSGREQQALRRRTRPARPRRTSSTAPPSSTRGSSSEPRPASSSAGRSTTSLSGSASRLAPRPARPTAPRWWRARRTWRRSLAPSTTSASTPTRPRPQGSRR